MRILSEFLKGSIRVSIRVQKGVPTKVLWGILEAISIHEYKGCYKGLYGYREGFSKAFER